jgi:anaerobic ribonucleoside-triphosphate reductase activating protein
MPTKLTTVRLQDQTTALGPGKRAVIWFHGCALNCPGCIAKEMNEATSFTKWTPADLAKWVLSRPDIEGVTLSGGDPLDQNAEALWELVDTIRTKSKLTLLCYTGKTLGQLQHAPTDSFIHKILSAIDLLIDGPYVETLNNGSLWRGSANQQVHFLSDRYADWKSEVNTSKNRKLELKLAQDGAFDLTGIPPAGFLKSLQIRLKEKGLSLTH